MEQVAQMRQKTTKNEQLDKRAMLMYKEYKQRKIIQAWKHAAEYLRKPGKIPLKLKRI